MWNAVGVGLLFAVFATGQTISAVPTAAAITGGLPRIDVLDFYGLHNVTPELLRQASGLREGLPLPPSRGDTEEQINDLRQIVSSHLEAICCEDGKTVLYIGVEERGAPHFDIRPAPGGADVLPNDVVRIYQNLQDAVHAATKKGGPSQDVSHGHPIMLDPAARIIQQSLPALVASNLDQIRLILHESGDEYQRAVAAYLIGYAPKQEEIVQDLRDAVTDADPIVRGNAVDSLTSLALLQRSNPSSKVQVSTNWMIDMLNSTAWSDRVAAVRTLGILTEDRDSFTLSRLRGTPRDHAALDALIEMSRWKTRSHARPAFDLVGRIAGLSDKAIGDAWNSGNEEEVIRQVEFK
ncbi:MAG: hypothetical protein ABI824_10985 [Acidobacteriota bacterium]